MNNKGQTLVIFVLLLPVLLLVAAYIVDKSYMLYQANKLNSINETIIESISNKTMTVEEIEELFRKNDPDIIITQMDLDPNIDITIEKDIDSIFGRIIGLSTYKVKSHKTGEYNPPESIE